MSKLSATELQSKARDLVGREVNVCVSSLVSTLASGCGLIDAAPKAYRADGTALRDLAEQAFELSAPIQDYEEAAIQAGWSKRSAATASGVEWVRNATAAEVEAEEHHEEASGDVAAHMTADRAEDACELDGLDPYDRDVFEHWSVSQWFGEKLAAAGEKVDFDFAGMVVWGRTTTGQAIYADDVIERIAAELHA